MQTQLLVGDSVKGQNTTSFGTFKWEDQHVIRHILEHIIDGIAIADENGTLVYFNKTAQILGIGAQGARNGLQTEADGFLYPGTLQPIPAELLPLARALKGETIKDFEMIARSPQKGPVKLSVTSSPIYDGNGNPKGAVAILRDITEQRRLSDSLFFHSRILSNITECVIVSDANGFIIHNNVAAENMFGYQSNEMLGKHVSSLYQIEDSNLIFSAVVKAIDEKGIWQGELKQRSKNGSAFMAVVSCTALFIEGKKHYVSVRQDVTAQKRTEADLVRSQKRLDSLYKSQQIGVAIGTAMGQITEANDTYLKLIGYTRQELEQGVILWPELTSPEYRHIDTQLANAIFSGEPSTTAETQYTRRDGTQVSLLLSLTQLQDGDKANCLNLAIDITERKKAEALLAIHQKNLASATKMSALGTMASGIAHEINNPLAIIHAAAADLKELAEAGKLDIPEVIRASHRIESTALRIASIIKGLRSFAREGENDAFQNVSVSEIINDTLTFCAERFNKNGVQLILPETREDIRFDCRPTQIAQVLLNLFNNSCSAIERLTDRWIKVEVTHSPHHVELNLTDSGPGISPEIQNQMFQPFFTTQEIGKGTGLGLSISKGLVESHHGSLLFDSTSKNTRFVVRLPKIQTCVEGAGNGR